MAYCGKCNHTGLLPFIKNGEVIPNVLIDCECRQEEQEREYNRYRDIIPTDIDFPCSDSFRGYYQKEYGSLYDRMIEHDIDTAHREPVIVQAPSPSAPWDSRQQHQVDQMRGELTHIRGKLAELTKPKQKKQPAKPSQKKYTGLVINDEQSPEW